MTSFLRTHSPESQEILAVKNSHHSPEAAVAGGRRGKLAVEHHALGKCTETPSVVHRHIGVRHKYPLRPVAVRLHRQQGHIISQWKTVRWANAHSRHVLCTVTAASAMSTHCVLLPCACTGNEDTSSRSGTPCVVHRHVGVRHEHPLRPFAVRLYRHSGTSVSLGKAGKALMSQDGTALDCTCEQHMCDMVTRACMRVCSYWSTPGKAQHIWAPCVASQNQSA